MFKIHDLSLASNLSLTISINKSIDSPIHLFILWIQIKIRNFELILLKILSELKQETSRFNDSSVVDFVVSNDKNVVKESNL